MFMNKAAAGLLLLSYGLSAAAHGIVKTLLVDGQFVQGYDIGYSYQKNPPVVAGWSIPTDRDTGFVSNVKSPDIICHVGATPGGTHATVKAGGKIEFQWTKWPHDGPVLTYMANCNGPCEKVDKTTLKFFKIDEAGMLIARPALPQAWATDELKADNNSWTVTIPTKIAPGNYVVRHETIALHAAQDVGGAQFYPQCFNFEVTGTGTENPDGVVGTALYDANAPGVHFNMYWPVPKGYTIPGPPLYAGAIATPQDGTMPMTGVAPVNTTSNYTMGAGPYANSSSSAAAVVAPQSYDAPEPSHTMTQTVGPKPSGAKPIHASHKKTFVCTHTTMVEDTATGAAAASDSDTVAAAAAAETASAVAMISSSSVAAAVFAKPTADDAPKQPMTTPPPAPDAPKSITLTKSITSTEVVLPVLPSTPPSAVYSVPMPANSLLPVNTTTATNLTNISINTTAIHNHTTHRPHFGKGQLPKNLTATYEAPPLPANATWDDFWAWVVKVVEGGWFFRNGGKGNEPAMKKRHARNFQYSKSLWY